MNLKYLSTLLISGISITIFSQTPDSLRIGIHQAQSEYYSIHKPLFESTKASDLSFPLNLVKQTEIKGSAKVLGWHPYWAASTAYQNYDYNALTHIAYFSYEVDTATGGYTTIHDWTTTPIISYALGSARNTEILTDTSKQVTLLNNVVTLLRTRNGDGVNFDFESVPLAQRANMVSFVQRAVRIIKDKLPEAEISLATPAVDWSNAWDLATLSELCDYIIIMGYNYYYSGSSTAGPVAPLEGESYNVTRTVNTYLSAGVEPGRLLLGVPWYGIDWPVVSNARKAAATGSGTSKFFTAAEAIAETHGKTFDQLTKVPWVAYTSASLWRQLWYDDVQSLDLKYDLVSSKDLGGIGIWALSYEGGNSEIWESIKSSFNIYESETDKILKLYPVPSAGQVTVEFYLTTSSNIVIEIFDIQGRKIMYSDKGNFPAGQNILDFDISGVASGVYICTLLTETTLITKRILIIGKQD